MPLAYKTHTLWCNTLELDIKLLAPSHASPFSSTQDSTIQYAAVFFHYLYISTTPQELRNPNCLFNQTFIS